jgi:hypothetical protein
MPLKPEALRLLRLIAKCPIDGLRVRFCAERYLVARAMTWPFCRENLVELKHSPKTGYVVCHLTDAGRAVVEAGRG